MGLQNPDRRFESDWRLQLSEESFETARNRAVFVLFSSAFPIEPIGKTSGACTDIGPAAMPIPPDRAMACGLLVSYARYRRDGESRVRHWRWECRKPMLVRRVLLVDAQPIFRDGLRLAIDAVGGFTVAGIAGSGYQAMQEAERARPHLIVIDTDLPGMNGFAIASALLRAAPERMAVMMSEQIDHDVYDRARARGAFGVISSRITPVQLRRVLRRIANHQPLFWEPEIPPAEQQRTNVNRFASSGLTMREIEVLDCVAQGFSNRDIAMALFVNEQTIKNHLTSIYRKLDVDDRVQALRLAIERGWIEFAAAR